MSTNEKKGVTVKIDAELHAEIKRYIEEHEMTMADFVTLALQDELHPKLNIREEKNMGNMRTMAFQVSEELFQKIKDYLQRNNMTQKQFMIGLIENEINRDLAQRAAQTNIEKKMGVLRDLSGVSAGVGEQPHEQENTDVSTDFDGENEEIEDQDESESMGMSMVM